MIIGIKKYIFVGVQEDLDLFFEKAQQRGIIEFIPTDGRRPIEPSPAIQTLTAALKILRKQPVVKQSEKREEAQVAIERAEKVIRLKSQIESFYEERRIATAELARVAPLGNFFMEEVQELEKLAHRKVQFFCVKCSKRDQLRAHEELIYIGTDYDLDYFITITPSGVSFPEMIEMHVEEAAPTLRHKLREIEHSLHSAEHELKALADQMDFLNVILIQELNEFNLAKAKKEVGFPIEDSLFAIEAWVPENKIPDLFGILQGLAVHCETVLIEEGDRIPTYMENKGLARVGEDLVNIYDTPSPRDKDPSLWVLCAFAVFFAMIIADAGYGFLFLTLGLFLYWKFPRLKGMGKRFIKLLLILATSCIIWGALSTSYFGLEILPTNPLSKISIVSYLAEKKANYHLAKRDEVYTEWVKKYPNVASAKTGTDFIDGAAIHEGKHTVYPILNEFKGNVLLEISLLLGLIHISLSLLRYATRNWAAIGWIIFMVGGYLFFPYMLHATSLLNFTGIIDKPLAFQIGLQMIYVGVSLAVVLALIQHKWKGLHEVMNVITIFGDVLSYLRLYALALAATIMAETFNKIGAEVGLVLGTLIIIAGQGINIVLGAMGGIIHGLRLNFIEWYHYSFEGGGRLFRPLRKLKVK